MRSGLVTSCVTLLLAGLAVAGDQTSPQAEPGPVDVPRGDGAPVITDGTFTPGEWDDALRIDVNDDLSLHVKEHRGVVFIGVRGLARVKEEGEPPWAADHPSDGLEFAIRRSKLPGPVWRLRLSASGFFGGKPGMVAYPPAAAERDTARWLELRLN